MRNSRCLSGCLMVALAVSLLSSASGQAQNSPTAAARRDWPVTVRALAAQPGEVSLYEIRFTTGDSLAARAEIILDFPAEFDLSLLRVASSTSINGGFKLVRERNQVRVQRTGLGAMIPPGRNVELQLGLIKNPGRLTGNYEVGMEIRSSSQSVLVARKNHRIEF
ncbi:MAG: hypothetical protein ONB48_04335 [candidate division KSB1 bacterium]|nr:hypothetical protein [candidate division KSB1 bacterium]MDZ7274461.1 hypothetical protein [candidate division KSB1 bacterium]MDZ7284877.1 hypothetical protein [candidate division KSB1 bacterium]MDZ7297702.1 hypothetical protein [candidate division KSB1 bacterium]MDZ7305874.1 hypothetical protein [candidate division KSB1 bacterium]